MKTISTKKKKAMKTRTFIFVLALIPALSFATSNTKSFPLEASVVETNIAEEDVLEDWMIELDSWSENTTGNAESTHPAVEDLDFDTQETELEFENWMTEIDDNSWEITDNEQEVEIENWMTNPSTWLNN